MAKPKNASALWLAIAAGLVVAPVSARGQLVSGPVVYSEPIILSESFPVVSGSGFPPGGGMRARATGESAAPRIPGENLIWHTLHSRGWQALRGFVPSEEGREERLAVADTLFREALTRIQPYQAGDNRVAATYNSLAWTFYLRGQYDEARGLARWVLDDRLAREGEFSPRVADTEILLARVALAQERYDEAEALAKKALAAYIRATAGREQDLHIPIAMDTLGMVYMAQDRLDVADAYIRRALEWREDLYEANMYPIDRDVQVLVELAKSYITMSTLLTRMGRDQEAGVLSARATSLLESSAGAPGGMGGGGAPPAPGPAL